jgi:undecaprenyl-diphosphatase
VTTLATTARRSAARDSWWRAWPLTKPALLVLAKGGAVLIVVWSAVGLVMVRLLDDGPVGEADRDGARWLEDRRTPTWNSFTHWGSMLSDTLVKVALVAVVGGAMVLLWRRWHDGVFLAVVVSFEATVFVIVSFIVGRERPPVVHLDPPAPSGSFPSGHTAAAVAFYAGLFVVARWHTRHRGVLLTVLVVAIAFPITVGVSRVFRGMHYPIDVVAGLILGLAAIVVVRRAIVRGVAEIDHTADDALPDRLRHLDLTAADIDARRTPSGAHP